MYRERMNSYYPEVIKAILEFKGIIDGEYPEFEDIQTIRENVLNDAYLTTMGEERVSQWEQIFGIKPVNGSKLSDRREVIMARIKGHSKLNTELINAIVNTFTGGTANSWVKDSTLYVEVTPPRGNKQYIFENVEQELKHRIPAHLNFNISRNYFTWEEIKSGLSTWGDVKDNYDIWEDVCLFTPFQ